MRHVIGKNILQQLHIVVTRLDHVAKLALGLLLPEKIQTGSHLDETPVVRHHDKENDQEYQHLRRQWYSGPK